MFVRLAKILLAVAIALYLSLGIYNIQPDESGVAFLFGKVVERRAEPGVHWNAPWPFGRQVIQKTATQYTAPVGYMTGRVPMGRASDRAPDLWLTGGSSVIRARLDVQFTISDLADFLINHDDPLGVMVKAAERVFTRFLVQNTVDDVLINERALLRLTVMAELQKLLDEGKTGVQVRSVDIVELAPPSEGDVDASFQDVQTARTDRERAIQNARAQEAQVMTAAQAKVQELANQAASDSHARVELAKGRTERFLALAKEHAAAPANTEQRIYLEKIEKLLPKIHVYVVEAKSQGRTGLRVVQ